MTGLPFDADTSELAGVLANPSNLTGFIQSSLMEKSDDTGESPAEVIADLINIQRADTKKLAAAHDIDVSIGRMTPERATQLLVEALQGDPIPLLEVFNEMSDQRASILQAVLDDEEYRAFMAAKHEMMWTQPEDDESTEA